MNQDMISRADALARIVELTKKWGNPVGSDEEQGAQDHGVRLHGAIRTLPAIIESAEVTEEMVEAACVRYFGHQHGDILYPRGKSMVDDGRRQSMRLALEAALARKSELGMAAQGEYFSDADIERFLARASRLQINAGMSGIETLQALQDLKRARHQRDLARSACKSEAAQGSCYDPDETLDKADMTEETRSDNTFDVHQPFTTRKGQELESFDPLTWIGRIKGESEDRQWHTGGSYKAIASLESDLDLVNIAAFLARVEDTLAHMIRSCRWSSFDAHDLRRLMGMARAYQSVQGDDIPNGNRHSKETPR